MRHSIQETHQQMRYSEREIYDDVVYALYEIKKEKKIINISQHS